MRAEPEREQQQSRVLHQFCYSIIHILKGIPILNSYLADESVPSSSTSTSTQPVSISQMSPAAIASFIFGISFALMLFGSITFVIGFILMPWVLGLVLLLYLSGLASNLSEQGRSFFCSRDVPASS